jgi:hypothetical protein
MTTLARYLIYLFYPLAMLAGVIYALTHTHTGLY